MGIVLDLDYFWYSSTQPASKSIDLEFNPEFYQCAHLYPPFPSHVCKFCSNLQIFLIFKDSIFGYCILDSKTKILGLLQLNQLLKI